MSNKSACRKIEGKTPDWLLSLMNHGYMPYIATSERLLPHFNMKPFGIDLCPFVMERQENKDFLEAYLLSNSLSFKSPNYKMPGWVYVDCVLLQESVVGFMKLKEEIPKELLLHYQNDAAIDCDFLEYIPVSGQVDAQAVDGSLVNFSLFSLGREVDGFKNLSLYTKLLSLETHGAKGKECRVIAQYDNPAIKTHGRASLSLEIEQPMVPIHPGKDMTLILKMSVNYDSESVDVPQTSIAPTFWLNANDIEAKHRMQEGIKNGKQYFIAPPFSVTRDDGIFLPIIERS
ncbi:MAG: hypothetical protein PHX43_01025 [Alphaproteobacteria bacterium]|nr:hypothetical protein [Alphaproteobacteria bacterium]